jgi:CPA2 family monovalent cation:H+ antiporter-2
LLAAMHELPIITTIAAGFTAAWILGLITQRLGLSPIVGYILAGILIGPHTPGYIGDVHIAQQLAEVGVILLMFGVGLHFHLKDLLAVKSVAIPGAIGQSLVATGLAILVFAALGMPLKAGAVIGMAMSVASTVVLMRVLMDADALSTPSGHVAVGWLLVEDVFTVIVLVLLPVLAGAPGPHASSDAAPPNLWVSMGMALLKLTALVAIVALAGSRIILWVLVQVTRLRSRELFTLTVLVFSIAIAAASYYFFGASMALGAFLAGMVVAQSPVSHQAAADALPLRDAFAVLFFVSVGMLFDPAFIVQEPLMLLAAMAIILIAKPLAALAIVALLGHSPRTALTVAIGLAQIGEFSFILANVARDLKLMPDTGQNVLIASAILSIALNPLLFRSLPRIEAWLKRRPLLWNLISARAERRLQVANAEAAAQIAQASAAGERRAVVVGFGPVGRSVDRLLREAGLRTTIIDMNMETVSRLNAQGQTALFGDASRAAILEQAGVPSATHLVVTLPQPSGRAAIVAAARDLKRDLRIFVRARYLAERDDLEHAGATAAVFEEAESAVGLARLVLTDTGASRDAVDRSVRELRMRLILDNVSSLAALTVRSVMVPWMRVHRLSQSMSLPDVLREMSKQRFSRWPVVDPMTDRPVGYLLAKDLVAEASTVEDWTRLIRPLRAVHLEDNIESTLQRFQQEAVTVCVVEDAARPIGIITIEDILEQVVGRMEDEYPHSSDTLLKDSLLGGGVVLHISAETPQDAIGELAALVPRDHLPPNVDVVGLAIAREREVPTDVGLGVAIPHARCPSLRHPIVVFGRAPHGIVFSPRSTQPVRLIFLLITPNDQPDLQLSLLAQLATIAASQRARDALLHANTETDVVEAMLAAIARASPSSGG